MTERPDITLLPGQDPQRELAAISANRLTMDGLIKSGQRTDWMAELFRDYLFVQEAALRGDSDGLKDALFAVRGTVDEWRKSIG